MGHEVDVSIADLVADRRALTPSEAGELVVPSANDMRTDLRQSAARIHQIMAGRIERLKQQLDAIASRNVFQRPMSLIDERRQRCDDVAGRADRAIRLQIERIRQRQAATTASLDALSPLSVLARGYSLTTFVDGTLVNSVSKVEDGAQIQIRVSDGVISATVKGTD